MRPRYHSHVGPSRSPKPADAGEKIKVRDLAIARQIDN
jgi:hypothetical protein